MDWQRKIANLFNWVCIILNKGKFSSFLRIGLWAEAANIPTLLENNLITKAKDLSLFQQFLEGKMN